MKTAPNLLVLLNIRYLDISLDRSESNIFRRGEIDSDPIEGSSYLKIWSNPHRTKSNLWDGLICSNTNTKSSQHRAERNGENKYILNDKVFYCVLFTSNHTAFISSIQLVILLGETRFSKCNKSRFLVIFVTSKNRSSNLFLFVLLTSKITFLRFWLNYKEV